MVHSRLPPPPLWFVNFFTVSSSAMYPCILMGDEIACYCLAICQFLVTVFLGTPLFLPSGWQDRQLPPQNESIFPDSLQRHRIDVPWWGRVITEQVAANQFVTFPHVKFLRYPCRLLGDETAGYCLTILFLWQFAQVIMYTPGLCAVLFCV